MASFPRMTARRIAPITTAIAAICCLQAAGVANEPPKAPATTPPSPLQGPVVKDADKRSLVRYDFEGRFERVEGRPEEAAVRRMPLDPERRQLALEAIDRRAAALRHQLFDQIDLIKESSDATRSGDQETAQRLRRELYDRLDPGHPRDPLADPIRAVLSPEESVEWTRLVDEYWAAWIEADQRARAGPGREATQVRLQYELFQTELGDAYATTLRPIQQKLDNIYAAVDPTPEQREAIRTAVIDYLKRTRGQTSADERERLAKDISSALDEDRRLKLIAAALSAL